MTYSFTIDDTDAATFNSAICFITGGPTDPSLQAAWVKQQMVAWYQATARRGLDMQAIASIVSQVSAVPIVVI